METRGVSDGAETDDADDGVAVDGATHDGAPLSRRHLLQLTGAVGAVSAAGAVGGRATAGTASGPAEFEIAPRDVEFGPGGSYLLSILVPDEGTVEDVTVTAELDGAGASVVETVTLSGDGGFVAADRTDSAADEQLIRYETDALSTGDTILLEVSVPETATVTDGVTLAATYRATGSGLIGGTTIAYDETVEYALTGRGVTFESLAEQAERRSVITSNYAAIYHHLLDGSEFDTILRRSITEAFLVVGAEVVKQKTLGALPAVGTISEAIDAYDTAIEDGGSTGQISGLLAPLLAELGSFRGVYLDNLGEEDDTGTSLERLAHYQQAEADAWRDGDRDAAIAAIENQAGAICLDDSSHWNIYDGARRRDRYPCVFRGANEQRTSNWVPDDVAPYFEAVMAYASEEQTHLDEHLEAVASRPDPSVEAAGGLPDLDVGERTTVDITVSNAPSAGISDRGYLSISHGTSLELVDVERRTDDGTAGFERYDAAPGETIRTSDGEGIAEYPLTDLVASFGPGDESTYAVTVERTTADDIWVTYRAGFFPIGEQREGEIARAPKSGDTDQQGWPARRVDVDAPFFEVSIVETNDPVEAGAALEVAVEVENSGDEFDSQTVTLVADGAAVASTTVRLDAGRSVARTLSYEPSASDVPSVDLDVTTSGSGSGDSTTASVEEGATGPTFEVAIEETTAPVDEGDPLEVTASVTNVGDEADEQTLQLAVHGGTVDAESIELGPGEATRESLTYETNGSDPPRIELVVETDGPGTTATAEAMVEEDASRRELWRYDASGSVRSSPTVVDGTLYVGNEHGTVFALDASTGRREWSVGTGGAVESSPTVVDRTTYFGTAAGYVVAVDAESGEERWRFETDGAVRSSPTVSDRTVYVGCMDGGIYALDADTGERRWRTDAEDSVESAPTVADQTVYAGSHDGAVYALDASAGDRRWRYDTGFEITASPTVADGTVYSGDWKLYAVDAETGAEEWVYEILNSSLGGSPTVVDGSVVFSTQSGTVRAVDAASGDFRWSYTADGFIRQSSPTVVGDTVFVGSDGDSSGEIHAIEAGTGDPRWAFETEDWVLSSPTVVDGVLYVGAHSRDQSVYALETDADGSSEDSRVRLGTLGHHDRWAEQANPGEFTVDILDADDPIVEGEGLAVELAVENTDDRPATQPIGVDVGGVAVTQDVSLDAGAATIETISVPTAGVESGSTSLVARSYDDEVETTVEVRARLSAAVEASRDRPSVGDPVTFDAATSEGPITRYEWYFDNGSSATGETVTHTFATGGEYAVELTVTDTHGRTAAAEYRIDVAPACVSVPSAIDETGDGTFTDEEMDRAIDYWETDAEVPGTCGETIDDGTVLELIERWRDGGADE